MESLPDKRLDRHWEGSPGALKRVESAFFGLPPVRALFNRMVAFAENHPPTRPEYNQPYVDCTGQEVSPPPTHTAAQRRAFREENTPGF